MKRPQEHEYTSHVAYSRALEAYCNLLEQPAQDEPQYAGTVRELFTNSAIERLDVRPSTKVYLGTPSVCEQPAQDAPVAWLSHNRNLLSWDKFFDDMEPLYTLPQAREPLTDEDIRKINQEVWGYVSADHTRMWEYARAIEAKLREKNT